MHLQCMKMIWSAVQRSFFSLRVSVFLVSSAFLCLSFFLTLPVRLFLWGVAFAITAVDILPFCIIYDEDDVIIWLGILKAFESIPVQALQMFFCNSTNDNHLLTCIQETVKQANKLKSSPFCCLKWANLHKPNAQSELLGASIIFFSLVRCIDWGYKVWQRQNAIFSKLNHISSVFYVR